MSHQIDQLVAGGPPDREHIERFIAGNTFPLVNGRGVTFVFHGKADEVKLRHFIFGLQSSQPMKRIDETDLWFLDLDLPECSRVEYKIERVVDGNHVLIMDPLNPSVAQDPFGANSVCYGLGYVTPDWTQPDSESRPGAIQEIALKSKIYGDVRPVRIYLPARFRTGRRYRLLVVHDGADYLRFAELKTVLDNLIHRLEIPPLIVALTEPGNRLVEYGADPRHVTHLTEELVPALEKRYPLIREAQARALMGASFGAVATLHTAWSSPGYFGGLLLQSGSFAFSDIGEHGRGPMFDSVASFINELRENPGRPAEKMFVSCGTYESLIYENRSLVPVLQGTGADVRYVEARDGHNWDNWRDRLREGLSWLFPGPLWMVYE